MPKQGSPFIIRKLCSGRWRVHRKRLNMCGKLVWRSPINTKFLSNIALLGSQMASFGFRNDLK